MKLKIIPDYEPVSKLYLSFENEFYNTRFKYGRVIAQLAYNTYKDIEVEIFIKDGDEEYLEKEFKKYGIDLNSVILTYNYCGTAITTSGFPIFAENIKSGTFYALTYHYLRDRENWKEDFKEIEDFGRWIAKKEMIRSHELNFDFNSAVVSAADNVVLISDDIINKKYEDEIKSELKRLIAQDVYFVPSLIGDYTRDLDTYLLPIKDKVWISADYNKSTPQYNSVKPAHDILRELGHTVHLVPGLEKIIHDDIDTLPNYQNSLIINDKIFVPSYKKKEDKAIQEILKDYNFDVIPVDSRELVKSNAVLHCISRTLPRRIFNIDVRRENYAGTEMAQI